MSGDILLGLSCFTCALFGAVMGAAVGGTLVWRVVRTRAEIAADPDLAEARGGSDLAAQRPENGQAARVPVGDTSDWQPSSSPPPDVLNLQWPDLAAGLKPPLRNLPRRQEPVVRMAAPVPVEERALLTLTDEEIDALPPELPAPGRPRKRIMPAPKGPTFKDL